MVCNYWTSNYSTDFEEMLRVPLFHLSLDLQGTKFGRPDTEGFKGLLKLACPQTLGHLRVYSLTRLQ